MNTVFSRNRQISRLHANAEPNGTSDLGKAPKSAWDYYNEAADAVDAELEANFTGNLESLLIVVSADQAHRI